MGKSLGDLDVDYAKAELSSRAGFCAYSSGQNLTGFVGAAFFIMLALKA